MKRHKGDNSIVVSHQQYLENATYREEPLITGRLLDILIRGSQSFTSMKSASMDDENFCFAPEGLRQVHRALSPSNLQRSPFYRWPQSWDPTITYSAQDDIDAQHYWATVLALVRAARPIRSFTISRHLATTALDSNNLVSPAVLTRGASPFSGLEYISPSEV